MDTTKISKVIDESFDAAFRNWTSQVEKELYPEAFANEYSWIAVKKSLSINNKALKNALKLTLTELLKDV